MSLSSPELKQYIFHALLFHVGLAALEHGIKVMTILVLLLHASFLYLLQFFFFHS